MRVGAGVRVSVQKQALPAVGALPLRPPTAISACPQMCLLRACEPSQEFQLVYKTSSESLEVAADAFGGSANLLVFDCLCVVYDHLLYRRATSHLARSRVQTSRTTCAQTDAFGFFG